MFRRRSLRNVALALQPSNAGLPPRGHSVDRRTASYFASTTYNGIELLNANEQLQSGDDGKLVVINEAVGDRQEVTLGR
jgi:hypothetical protein